jgi:RNA polymerase sigma-70 factor (ECF subfamily)
MASEGTACERPGQERLFTELIRSVEDELQGFVRKRVGGARHLAQDIVQRTFLLAWGDARFDPTHDHARAWLFTTARRLVLDWLDSPGSRSISLEDLSERSRRDGSRDPRDALSTNRRSRDPLDDLIDEERDRTLHAALERLADEQREVLERYYLHQEGSQFAIAEAMGLSVAAFNSRLNRARKELKRMILVLRNREGWTDNEPY